jgi:hypothetical protein
MDAVAQLVEKRHRRWGLFFAFLGWRILLMIKKERVVKEKKGRLNVITSHFWPKRIFWICGLGLPVMEKTERF